MNKQERKLKGYYKFKKRLANHNLMKSMTNPDNRGNVNAFRTTGKPCSCDLCSPAKSGQIKASDQRKRNKLDFILRCDIEVRNAQIKGYNYLVP